MKTVTLERTVMINGLPKGPNDGAQLVTNAQAQHLVDNGDVLRDNVEDVDAPDPIEADAPDGKTIDQAVKARLKDMFGNAAPKTLNDAVKAVTASGEAALEAEIKRIGEEGDAALEKALQEQKAEQDAAFEARVAEAVAAQGQ